MARQCLADELRSSRSGHLPILLLFLSLSGCVIPYPEHDLIAGFGEIGEQQVSTLEIDATTREEVLLRFGTPIYSANDEKVFVYFWQTVTGGWVGLDDMGHLYGYHILLMEFSDDHRLLRFDKKSFSDWSEMFTDSAIRREISDWSPHTGTFEIDHLIYDPDCADTYRPNRSPEECLPHFSKTLDPDVAASSRYENGLGGIEPVRIRLSPIRDESVYGYDMFLGNTLTHSFFLSNRPKEVIKDLIASQIRLSGHSLVDENEDFVLSATIQRFDFNAGKQSSIDGMLRVSMEVTASGKAPESLEREYEAPVFKEGSFWWGMDYRVEEHEVERVIVDALQDLSEQIATDSELAAFLSRT